MPAIKILPEVVASQIAAGEVVQRPASVVKELIDNSLDAGAGRISVQVEKGGNQLIRVVDDGCGISKEDLPVALRRHATSKIELETDLRSIRTHGFRGEALAAISSVSKTEIVSRLHGERQGCRLYAEASEVRVVEPVGAPPGTSVTVSDLFYNTPARKKFMKTATTEMDRVGEVVLRAALSYPDLHFELSHNGKRARHYPPVPSCADRLVQVFGNQLMKDILPVDHTNERIQIEGFASRPTTHRKSAGDMYFFVNRRFVRDRILMKALSEAYRASLPQRRYPVVVLFIELSPEEVDVNVHPTKEEIRFSDEGMIWRAVYAAVRDALSGVSKTWVATHEETPPQTHETERVETRYAPEANESYDRAPHPQQDAPSYLEAQTSSVKLEGPTPQPGDTSVDERRPLFTPRVQIPESVKPEVGPPPAPSDSGKPTIPATPVPPRQEWKVVCQVFDSFILCESGEEMAFFDQHALHERLLFEKFRKEHENGPIGGQNLMFPQTVEVAPNQAGLLAGSLPFLTDLGLEMEPFGDRTFVVRAVPGDLDLSEIEGLVQDALHDLSEQEVVSPLGDRAEKILARMACRSAIKANEPLDKKEMQHLVDRYTGNPILSTCPHGRPPIWRISRRELEKMFARP
jgi:DNA mismatch repair protein MutL